MSDKLNPDYWASMQEGDFVTLTDYQSLLLGGSEGKDYRIKGVRPIVIPEKESELIVAEYRLYELTAGEGQLLFFAVLRTGEEFELRVYYLPQGFAVGTRDRLIDLGQTWFFLPPPDPENFLASDLEYAPYPSLPPIEENGTTVARQFGPAGFGVPVYGYYRDGAAEVPVEIVEYSTEDEEALNPLMLILEERWILPDGSLPKEGGVVTPLLGCRILPDGVETYPGT